MRKINFTGNYSILIMDEIDLNNDSFLFLENKQYDLLILPNKFKDVESAYLSCLKLLIKEKNGEIIYV